MSYKPLSFGTGGNVTFGTTGSQITASAPGGGGGGGAAISAAGASASNGTVVFSNANGVSFGMAGSTVTASHNGLTSQSAQAFSAAGGSSAFQTLSFGNANGVTFSNVGGAVQASYTVPSTAGLLSAIKVSGGTSSANLSALTFSNANNVTFGLDGSVMTAQAPIAFFAGTEGNNLAAVSFVNGSGVSFGLNGSIVTASVNALSAINLSAGTASANLTAATFANSNGVSFGLNGSVITASVNAGAGGGIALGAGTQTATSGTVSFANSNGITFGMSGSNQITASYTVPSTAGLLSAVKISAGTTSNNLSALTFSNLNGVSFGLNGSVITGAIASATLVHDVGSAGSVGTAPRFALEDHRHAGVAKIAAGSTVGNTLGQTTPEHGNWVIAGTGGITVSGSTGGATNTVWLSVGTGALSSQSNQAFSAANGSATFQTLSFANSNGVSFSTGTQGLFASYTVPSTAGLLSAVNVSAGTTSQNLSALTFSNLNGVSFGLNGSVVTASHNALTSQSNQAVSAANGSSTFQTLSFANSNGVSFSTGTQGLFASHDGIRAVAVSAGTTSGTVTRLDFLDGDGVGWNFFGGFGNGTIGASYSQLNQAARFNGLTGWNFTTLDFQDTPSSIGQQVSWSVTSGGSTTSAYAVHNGLTNIRISAGTASNLLSALTFSNLNGVSFGLNGSVVTASVAAGGGGLTNINVSAGTTSQNLSAITFSNGSGVSFGLNGSVITASVNAGGAGPTMSMYPALPHAWATSSMYTGASTTVGGGSSSTLSFYMAPLVLPWAVTFNDVGMIISAANTSAGSGSGTHRHVLGIYTLNGGTLSRLTNFGWNAVHSQSSVTAQTLSWWAGDFAGSTAASTSRISGNVSATISNLHGIRMNASSSGSSLSAGQYYLAHAYNLRSSSVSLFNMGTAWRHSVSQFTGAVEFSNTTGPLYDRFNGIVSTVTTSPTQFGWDSPASIHTSAITATGGTSRNQWPLVILRSVTA